MQFYRSFNALKLEFQCIETAETVNCLGKSLQLCRKATLELTFLQVIY